jgi:hypothetical protein
VESGGNPCFRDDFWPVLLFQKSNKLILPLPVQVDLVSSLPRNRWNFILDVDSSRFSSHRSDVANIGSAV